MKTTQMAIILETSQYHYLSTYSFVTLPLTLHYPLFQQALENAASQHSHRTLKLFNVIRPHTKQNTELVKSRVINVR